MYDLQSSNIAYNNRLQILNGYDDLIQNLIDDGWESYFLNFMFNQIPGSASHRMQVMQYEVERVYKLLTRHVVRWPDRDGWRDLRPKFIGSPDLPVWKQEKELVRNLKVNEGLHYNVIALMPPTRRTLGNAGFEKVLFGRQSRLSVPLDRHLWTKRQFYHNDVLSRIHATKITQKTMTDYALKAFKNGRVGYDAIQLWT